jgi:preprotein translocase SecF subunit
MKGEKNFGVDFVGGTSLAVEYGQKVEEGRIRAALSAAGVQGDPMIQYQEAGAGTRRLSVQVRFEDGEKAEQVLGAKFADAGFKVVQKEEIGAQIGKELKTKGLYALLWSLVGMVIYISIRFEFGFAIGAMAALVHDALISVGIFCLLGRQLSAPMIAVVLTIVGYSVNDTIVVFDRIREGLKLWRGKSYFEVANIAINQTLSRTLLTAGTTILSALSLFLFGGGAINDFALLLLIGLVVGTYSSVFIATPIMLLWHGGNRPVAAAAPASKPARNGKPAKATA